MEQHPLVVLMRREPGVAIRILDAHVDDGTGHCPVCSRSDGAARTIWPCTLRHYAAAAFTIVCAVDGYSSVVSGPG